jgi:hypothetical protein
MSVGVMKDYKLKLWSLLSSETLGCLLWIDKSIAKDKLYSICECRVDERLQTKTKEFTRLTHTWLVVYYESIKRELKIRCIYECRCDERLQTKTKEFTRLTYTGLVVELEHLEIETSLIDEKFANAMGEYVT